MLDQDICHPSSSNWSNPLHLVPKPNGEIRPTGDYRVVNRLTIIDRYPLPPLQNFAHQLYRTTIFSKIDLRAYHQIPVHPDDVPTIAITTPFGLYEFLYMPFGLSNAAQTFQRFIHKVLHRLEFTFAYPDCSRKWRTLQTRRDGMQTIKQLWYPHQRIEVHSRRQRTSLLGLSSKRHRNKTKIN